MIARKLEKLFILKGMGVARREINWPAIASTRPVDVRPGSPRPRIASTRPGQFCGRVY